jgi:glycosyltransferase involved in cell wall biosynthesis
VIDQGPYVLFLGRINWKKGLDRLIESMPHAPRVRLIVAGNDEDGYQPALESLATRYGVLDRVAFAGPVYGADKAALIERARALVLPSYSENFGNVVLEAMAAGRPVVVSAAVGLSDLVRESGCGIVIDGGAEQLGTAIARLAADTSTGNEMGRRGSAAAERYSWSSVAAQMEALYESVRRC